MNYELVETLSESHQVAFPVSILSLAFLFSKEHPLCIKYPQFGHEIKVEKCQADQKILHQIEYRCDKAEEGYEANTYKEEG